MFFQSKNKSNIIQPKYEKMRTKKEDPKQQNSIKGDQRCIHAKLRWTYNWTLHMIELNSTQK